MRGPSGPLPSATLNSREKTMVSHIRTLATSFVRDEVGATTAEYGIIIVVVAGIAIFVLSQLNGALNVLYGKFAGKVNSVN
jgi:Flp pilus assembly pilin Flp